MRRMSAIAAAVVAAAASVLAASPARAAAPAPSITVVGDPAGIVHTLTPGVTARWYVGVTTRNVTVQQLTATLAASGDVAAPADDDLRAAEVGLSACSVPWDGAACPGAVSLVLAPTSLATIADSTASVSEQGAIAAQNHLLISVLLPEGTPLTVGGKTTVLRLDLSVLGIVDESAEPLTELSAGPRLPGHLARTGSVLGWYGVVAAGAVGAGALLAALARRRGDRKGVRT